ncbi:MAG: chorismate mutase [Armatimonadota bacterium]|nr:chorismate mutase [Armatimonadota bacterium]
MHVRGIRGATTAETNSAEAILDATRELLVEMARANGVAPHEIAAAFFASTPDLTAAYPAEAARRLGWTAVPLLSFADVDVPGALGRCIRILLLWNTSRAQDEIVHVYLRGATGLRPDLNYRHQG